MTRVVGPMPRGATSGFPLCHRRGRAGRRTRWPGRCRPFRARRAATRARSASSGEWRSGRIGRAGRSRPPAADCGGPTSRTVDRCCPRSISCPVMPVPAVRRKWLGRSAAIFAVRIGRSHRVRDRDRGAGRGERMNAGRILIHGGDDLIARRTGHQHLRRRGTSRRKGAHHQRPLATGARSGEQREAPW